MFRKGNKHRKSQNKYKEHISYSRRADKDLYPHDRRADKDPYPHDRLADSLSRLLYASGHWETNVSGGTPALVAVDWGPDSACGFSVFMGVFIMLVTIFYIAKDSIHLFRNTESSWLSAFLSAILSIVILLMLFASSLTLSLGFNKWCDLLTEPITRIFDCATADFISFAEELKDVYTKNFYTEFKMAEFANWTSFVCWIFLTVISLVKVYKYQQHENFMTSLDRERQRLLQKVGHQPDAVL